MNRSEGDIQYGTSDLSLCRTLNLLRQQKYKEAIEICDRLFCDGDRSEQLYDCAARAVVLAIQGDGFPADWPQSRFDALLRLMILQPERYGIPLALHHHVSACHIPGNPDALGKAARSLGPTLTSLIDEGCRDRSLLLMVLLLRDKLADWLDSAEISQWHLDLLPDFDVSDMALPYNMMFDRITFSDNVADLRDLIDQNSSSDLLRQLGSWKVVMLHWITASGRLDRDMAALAQTQDIVTAPTGSDLDSARRSIILRAVAAGKGSVPTCEPVSEFATFAADWASRCVQPSDTSCLAAADAALARLASRPWQAFRAAMELVQARAPFLHLGRRKPRVALCISGQLRGYRRAFPTWQAGLLARVDHETFVHSWNKIGRSGAEPFRAFLPFAGEAFCAAYRMAAHHAGLDETRARYPSLFSELAQSGMVSESELCGFYGTDHVVLEDDGDARFADWSNGRKMHYKIAAVADLLGERAGEFDFILRVRPDRETGLVAFSWADIGAATHGRPVLFADTPMGFQYAQLLVGDQLAVGTPAAMRIYAETYWLVPRLAEQGLFGCKDEYIGHVSLAQVCWHAGLRVERLPAKMGSLLEAEPLPSRRIADCLAQDAAGRMDKTDQALLKAVHADLSDG